MSTMTSIDSVDLAALHSEVASLRAQLAAANEARAAAEWERDAGRQFYFGSLCCLAHYDAHGMVASWAVIRADGVNAPVTLSVHPTQREALDALAALPKEP